MGAIIEPERFRAVAGRAAGGPRIAGATCAVLFGGKIYVGTSSPSFADPAEPARILRFNPDSAEWDTVYESPLVPATTRSHVPSLDLIPQLGAAGHAASAGNGAVAEAPRDSGYKSMCVFQAGADAEPALYVSAMSRAGALLLRSPDGERFEPVGAPGLGNPDLYALGSLTPFGGRLFAVALGTVSDTYLDVHRPPEPLVYVTDDPATGQWQPACASGFDDASNSAISTLCAANGRLYAGTHNADRGFQVWETRAEGEPPFTWTRVISDGAGAFNQSLTTSAMAEFQGALYIAAGVTGFGYDPVDEIGPASAELIRLYPEGSWDLISGRMRFTRDGLKVPLSLLGPGFGDFYNAAIPAIAEHAGVLYLGTRQWEPLRALELGSDPVGGYQLWASENGEDWTLLIEDGGGNPAEFAVTALASTPLGLLVGTESQSDLLMMIAERREPGIEVEAGGEILLGA